ncbi:ABC transporter permease, partial [Streptococcus gordonii]|nr:ABC transporter permease [Streptococcus gordonii]
MEGPPKLRGHPVWKKYLCSYRKMTNILLLLKVQLYSTFPLNDLRKGRGLGRYFKLGLLFLLVLLFSGYNLL